MALSRSAARTARHRRWLWALTACGGAAGFVAVEGQLHEQAQERGQTTVEHAQERATEAANSLKKTSGVAGALLRTAVSSAMVAVQERNFDPAHFRADLAATVADLASETPTRRHLVALGGGYFLDWLLQLAYCQVPSSGPDGTDTSGCSGGGHATSYGSSGSGNGAVEFSSGGDFGVVFRPKSTAAATGGVGRIGGLPPWGSPEGDSGGHAAVEPALLPPGSDVPAAELGSASAAAAATRLRREAERALESILRDDVAAGLLLDRPGAVPLLLRAVADGRSSGGVAEALAARAAEARSAAEAMTADLQEAVDVLRGRIGSSSGRGGGGGGGGSGGLLALQCTAAGLLSAWAAGSGANRAKLTGLGLQDVLAEVATAVSGLSDRAAVGLQWELLRLARVMAEHSSSNDSHHLAACVLPLLYTAADAAAAADAAMASYAVDTLAAAVRYGGAPVAEVVSSSTMPHLLWQLAEAMGTRRVLAAAAASPVDGKDGAAAAAAGATAGAAPGNAQSTAVEARAKTSRSWFSSRNTVAPAPAAGREAAPAVASAGGGGGGATVAPAAAAVKSRKVLRVQDPAVASSVATAVAELARCALLPEEQVPRWRDWLLDVLCADGFDPGTAAGTGTGTAAGAAAAGGTSAAGRPAAPDRTQGLPPLHQLQEERREVSVGFGASGPSGGAHQHQRLPTWLTLPEGARRQRTGSVAGGGGAAAAVADGRSHRPGERRDGGMDAARASVVAALGALSHMPGNHGLQAAHYWLSRLLSELASRTLPYTSLVYLEGPRAPQDLIHAVPVLPSYVKSVADALERAADAVADDSPPLPPHLEFDLAGSGLVARPTHDAEPRKTKGPSKAKGSGGRQGATAAQGASSEKGGQEQQRRDPQQAAADVAAYRQAAHVVDVVVAERKAADALEALCAIVAPDPDKQRWLLQRGVLPLLHRLTRTADDPRVVLQEQGQPGAERVEQAAAGMALAPAGSGGSSPHTAAAAAAARTQHAEPHSYSQTRRQQQQLPRAPAQHQQQQGHPSLQHHRHDHDHHQQQEQQQQPHQLQQQAQGQPAPAVVSELMSDHEGGPSLCLQRQVARMLALLALLQDAQGDLGGGGGAAAVATWAAAAAAAGMSPPQPPASAGGGGGGGWLPWLHHAATSSDCRLSSNATRALLHMAALDAAAAAAAGAGVGLPATASAPAATAPAAPPVFLDGIHLLDPGADHHWALLPQVANAATEAAALAAAATVTTAAAVSSRTATAGPGDDDSDSDARLPTGSEAPGATVAVSMAPAVTEAAATPPLPRPELADPSPAARGDVAVLGCGGSAAGGAAAVTMGCGAASVGGVGGMAAVPSVAATVLGAARYLVSWPLSLWGMAALTASYGAAIEAALPTQPVLAAATAAEPLRAAPPHASAAATALFGGAQRPSQLPAADGTKASGAGDPAGGGGGGDAAGGARIPAPAIPPYPAPYTDMATDSTSVNAGGDQPYTGGAAADGAAAAAPPSVDVVFVHGIRGGPFITWRKAGVMTRGSAASHMERSACWPSTWLAEDLPGARLLSVEYLAPVSAWEGESLSLEDNVSRVMGQLAAAGVGTGQRPVVFVAHSMGGLLVKEMLARSMDQAAEGGGPNAALAASTRGIVFFGTPHFGNALAAMGWKLRYVPGALPAPSLARLTPGPHLLSLNDRLRQLHDTSGGALRVVSLLEGQPTQLSGVIPRILIVAPDSAYPGFGAALTLPENDHIDCCKPAGRTSPAYSVVRDLVVHAMRVAAPGGG
ncbi:hypothetical protein PLESTB_000025100 [Pleodorina starrii]|uniref:GPI inositol-deacylase n=1 Tax=Pleodorina starrii TaxID=330485 RepID=A0A9W6B9Z2_9CHLO|nr:hypothetical protein PLESTM_001109500 [Pleodorina starrii]GLC47782.1 hypothetical protein PLESTB_000025100 [Pleodorina starrii]GLC70800.1 hypothetical protein PLESTF_001034500 [Pleodorina starrii]